MEHDYRQRYTTEQLGLALGGVSIALGLLLWTRPRLQRRLAERRDSTDHGNVKVDRAVTVNKPVHEVYDFWRRFDNFPKFMRHLESVEVLDARRSRWRAKAPAGMTVEWEAEMVEDREDDRIAWRSLPGSRIENRGSVRFSPAPGGRGTEIRVQLHYSPPAGTIGRNIAWLFGEEPDQQVYDDLRRFKQLMETGEIPLSDGPALWRAARPGNPQKIRSLAGVRS